MFVFESKEETLFSTLAVSTNHPDKICDLLSDCIVDEFLSKDPCSLIFCQCVIFDKMVLVTGLAHSAATIDCKQLIKDRLNELAPPRCPRCPLSTRFEVDVNLIVESSKFQSLAAITEDIKPDVPCTVSGYATSETEACMPISARLARSSCTAAEAARRSFCSCVSRLHTHAEALVTIAYIMSRNNPIAFRLQSVLLYSLAPRASVPTPAGVSCISESKTGEPRVATKMRESVLKAAPSHLIHQATKVAVRNLGSPRMWQGAAGASGYRSIVHEYGGWCLAGCSEFHGRDGLSAPRAGALAARWAAKSLVVSGLVRRCVVQITYGCFGAEPVSVFVDAYGSSPHSNDTLQAVLNRNFDFRTGVIYHDLQLWRPVYSGLSARGAYFGVEDVPWELARALDLSYLPADFTSYAVEQETPDCVLSVSYFV